MRHFLMDGHRRGSVAKRFPTNAKRDVTTRTFIPGKVFVRKVIGQIETAAATYLAHGVVKQTDSRQARRDDAHVHSGQGFRARRLGVRDVRDVGRAVQHPVHNQIFQRHAQLTIRDAVELRKVIGQIETAAATYPAQGVVKQIPDRRGAAPPTCMLHAWDDSPSDFGYV